MDTIEHLESFLDLLSGKLATVPEENGSDAIYNKSLGWDYSELMNAGPPIQLSAQNIMEQYQQLPISMNSVPIQNNRQTLVQYDNEIMMQPTVDQYIRQPQTYQSPVISSKSSKQMKDLPSSQVKPNTSSLGSTAFSKSLETVYCNYSLNNIESNISVDPLRNSDSVYQRHTQSISSTQDSNIRCKEETTQTLCILPHTLQTGAVIISPVNVNSVQKTDVLLPSTLTPTSPHIETSSQSLSSPTSPQGSTESPSREPAQKEQRRSHIHAEQKRRYNIKNGFDMIHSLIPHLNQNPNAKLSKAAMLQKSAEYIMQLRTERDQLKDEMDNLRQQIESLNTSISNCQSLLPATGAPVSRKREIKMQEMFDEYVRTRTMENWKFWIVSFSYVPTYSYESFQLPLLLRVFISSHVRDVIYINMFLNGVIQFSLLFKPLLGSFNNFVSTANLTELYRTTCQWAEQHCTLGDLRPVVFNSLKYLCTKTDILTNPDQLPEEAKKQVISGPNLPNEL
ncbi:basic helix-loop-helix zip transcription factor [Holotrichia oblita]|uniref:Basic helix-loop-helix zip transcription factor n=2 Tax=Holotrichia oblita TaxID=644536 RepID=A0ACB9TEW0_HOLOL|nr:basic helix-loop-helix zip transcription factor [Holotrichia oblita]KAI4465327.1 basic helix-loop-helix zip transcription factor [Holotrichia oblita]